MNEMGFMNMPTNVDRYVTLGGKYHFFFSFTNRGTWIQCPHCHAAVRTKVRTTKFLYMYFSLMSNHELAISLPSSPSSLLLHYPRFSQILSLQSCHFL